MVLGCGLWSWDVAYGPGIKLIYSTLLRYSVVVDNYYSTIAIVAVVLVAPLLLLLLWQ